MNKTHPSNKIYELIDSDFNIENKSLSKNIESNIIEKYKIFYKSNIKSNRNFLPKPIIESEKDIEKDFPYEFQNNYIFQYYKTTIEYLKKYKKIYNNYNISSIKDNYNNKKDKSINEEKKEIPSSINADIKGNLNIKSDINKYKYANYLFLNNSTITKFYSNNGMDTLYTNKIRESKINVAINDKENLTKNISEEKSKDNLNENENEIKNLILNIDYPPFKPSNLNDKKENIKKENKKPNITQKSSSNTILESNTCENIRNEDDEYLIEMFGKKGWICLLCNNFNYETRIKCNRCGELKKPKKITTNLKLKMKIGQKDNNQSDNQSKDWICFYCKNFNYSFRDICNRCKIPKTTQFVYNYNPTINNCIKSNYPSYQQFFILFNNFRSIYINNIAKFMCK